MHELVTSTRPMSTICADVVGLRVCVGNAKMIRLTSSSVPSSSTCAKTALMVSIVCLYNESLRATRLRISTPSGTSDCLIDCKNELSTNAAGGQLMPTDTSFESTSSTIMSANCVESGVAASVVARLRIYSRPSPMCTIIRSSCTKPKKSYTFHHANVLTH